MAGPDERLFVRVVEAGSLKAAAKEVGADPSTVSRRLASLENRLGVQLLERSTRRSKPTDAGMQYYQGLRSMIDEQDALEASVSGNADVPRGKLRVTTGVDFGARFVLPALYQLQQSAPDLEVELLLGSTYQDIVQNNIDVAIRIGALADSSLICRKLGMIPRVIVGSPKYLNKHGRPQQPEDLNKHHFIFYAPDNADHPVELTGPGGTSRIYLSGRFTVNNVTAIRNLVMKGAGLHLGPDWAFHDDIARGEVEVVLSEWETPAYPIHALYASTTYVPAKIRIFIDLMVNHIRAEPAFVTQ